VLTKNLAGKACETEKFATNANATAGRAMGKAVDAAVLKAEMEARFPGLVWASRSISASTSLRAR